MMRFFLQAFRLVMLSKGNDLKKLKNLGGESWRCQAKKLTSSKNQFGYPFLVFRTAAFSLSIRPGDICFAEI